MDKRRGSCKGQKDFNTEMRLLISRLSRAVADKQCEVEALAREQRQLLLRARVLQLVMQMAEGVVAVADALASDQHAGERLQGIAVSQELSQLQRQLANMHEELARLKSSGAAAAAAAAEAAASEAGAADDADDGMRHNSDCEGGAGGSASGGASSSGRASAARLGMAGGGGSDAMASGARVSGAGAGGSQAPPPRDPDAWMPRLEPRCWAVEESVAAVHQGTVTDHATTMCTFAALMGPLLSHVNCDAPDEPLARARLDVLRASLISRTVAMFLTTADSRVASTIYASHVGPKNGMAGGPSGQRLHPADAPTRLTAPPAVAHGPPPAGAAVPAAAPGPGGGPPGGGPLAEPPPGYWRWLVERTRLTHEQELLFEVFVSLWRERAAPLWDERQQLLAALQGGPEAAAAALAARDERGVAALQAPQPGIEEILVGELEAVQRSLLLLQGVFGITAFGSLLTSWQVGQVLALAQPFVPSFLVIDQGLRELKAQKAERTAGGGGGLKFRRA